MNNWPSLGRTIVFNTIADVQAFDFAGNAFSDQAAFDAIDVFVQNESNSVADRAEALRVLGDKGMGLGREEEISDEQLLEEYMAECED